MRYQVGIQSTVAGHITKDIIFVDSGNEENAKQLALPKARGIDPVVISCGVVPLQEYDVLVHSLRGIFFKTVYSSRTHSVKAYSEEEAKTAAIILHSERYSVYLEVKACTAKHEV